MCYTFRALRNPATVAQEDKSLHSPLVPEAAEWRNMATLKWECHDATNARVSKSARGSFLTAALHGEHENVGVA